MFLSSDDDGAATFPPVPANASNSPSLASRMASLTDRSGDGRCNPDSDDNDDEADMTDRTDS
jgi:hypothetical protein